MNHVALTIQAVRGSPWLTMTEHYVTELWHRFKATGNPEAREALILNYSPLLKFVMGRVGIGLPRNVEQSDLTSYGISGLIEAIDNFDLERGFKFETYAIARIRQAILDELEPLGWAPRSFRARAHQIVRWLAELQRRRKQSAAARELAVQSPPFEAVLRKLSERERLVIALHYFEDLTLAEITDRIYGPNHTGRDADRVVLDHMEAVMSLRRMKSEHTNRWCSYTDQALPESYEGGPCPHCRTVLPPDEGGGASVREPRRPFPPDGPTFAVADEE